MFRRIEYVGFNATPTTNPTAAGPSDPTTGVVTGSLNATERYGFPLTYTVATNPTHGTVVLHPDGSFTYTPTPAFAAAGGTDTFITSVSDAPGFALPGLLGLLQSAIHFGAQLVGLAGADATRNRVTVTVAPTATSPVGTAPVAGTPTVGTPDPVTGVVLGSLNFTPTTGLTYTASTPAAGTVTVDAAGNFTYTPTATARHDAASTAPGAVTTDTFIATATNSGGATPVSVTVAISPTNDAPLAGTPTIGNPDPTTGAVTGTLGFTDPNNDTLSYATTTGPTHGTVTVTATGAYTYTPTTAARAAASASSTDVFTISANDAHGGTTAESVTVPISPTTSPVGNGPVAGTPTVGTPDPVTGVVLGTLNFTPASGVTYTTSTPATGTVTVDAAGNFTYTPTATARHAAASTATGAVTTDTFIATATNSGGATPVSVTVAISPTNDAPLAGTPTVGTPDPITGAVTGTLGFTDPNNDTLSYQSAIPFNLYTGGVTVDAATGTYTYTPTLIGRYGATPGDAYDVYVTADDGHGGTNYTTFYVPSSPSQATGYAIVPVGGNPQTVTLNPTGTRAYVTNAHDNTLSVLNTATNTVTTTIPTGKAPDGVTFSPDGTRAYITNNGDNTVSVLNTATNTITATIPVGNRPQAGVLNPDGTRLYVPNYTDGSLSVIDTTTNTVTATIAIPGDSVGNPSISAGVAISPDGTRAYVTNPSGGGSLTVINTATNTIVGTRPDLQSQEVVLSPDGTRLYVTDYNSFGVSEIDTTTLATVATIGVEGPQGLAVSPDGSHLYVTTVDDRVDGGLGDVTVIDTATNTITDYLPVGNYPQTTFRPDLPLGVTVSPDGTHLYVTNPLTNKVTVIPLASGDV